jgi:hypothetical protein
LDFARRETAFLAKISKTEEEKHKKIMRRSVAVAIASRFLAKENGQAPEKLAAYYADGLMYGANIDDAAGLPSGKPAKGKEGREMAAHLSFASDIATLAGFPPLGKKRKPEALSAGTERIAEKIIKIVKKEIKNAEKFLREREHA